MKKWSLPQNSKPATRQFSHGDKRILNLGAGTRNEVQKEGIPVTVDLREDCHPDYRCDIRFLPFESESWDIVYSSHVLEHFKREEIPSILDEWVRVLKVGGLFRIVVPDLAFAAKQIVEDRLDTNGMNVLYGQQAYSLDFHHIGFTAGTLRSMLESRGLTIKKLWVEEPYNLCVEAEKNATQVMVGEGQGRALLVDDLPSPEKVKATKKRKKR